MTRSAPDYDSDDIVNLHGSKKNYEPILTLIATLLWCLCETCSLSLRQKQMNTTIIYNKLVIFPCREIKTKTYPNNFSEEGECTNWFRPFQRIVKNTNLLKMKMSIAKIKNNLCF